MVHRQEREVSELVLTETSDQLINKLKANVDPGDNYHR